MNAIMSWVPLGVVVLCLAGWAWAAEDLSVLPAKVDGQPKDMMMHAWVRARCEEALDRREKAYEKLKTPEDVRAYQKKMRAFYLEQLGPFPRRGPLNGKTVGTIDRGTYTIEKVIYESSPKHYVTAAFYLPKGKGPFPGVLVPCGHSNESKACEAYQRVSILLAQNGLAVLCYDAIGQGERHQLLSDKGKPPYVCTREHMVVSPSSIVVGRNVATYRIWDGMRGIDYLQSRPEVDPKRIGCTGNSGGGTLTSYIMAVDERVTCAAPSCYLTTFRRLLATIGPQDAEQCIHGQIGFGFDQPEYVIVRAPKPTLLCTATRDFFDITGSWDNFRQAKRIYMRLGHGERVDLAETDATHGFSEPLRVAAVRWMRRWLLHKDDAIVEVTSDILKPAQMQCTPKGETLLLDGARSVYDLNRDLGKTLAAKRKAFWNDTPRAKALDAVRKVVGVRRWADLPKPKVQTVGTISRDGYAVEKLDIQPGDGLHLPALLFKPARRAAGAPLVLYLRGKGKHVDAAPGGPIETLCRQGRLVLAADLRGLGETARKKGKHGYGALVGEAWAEATTAYMLGLSYVGMRTEDALTLARYLQGSVKPAPGKKPSAVEIIAIGEAGVPALHAAALEQAHFAAVTIRGSLVSFSDVLEHPVTKNMYTQIVHGALRTHDLDDLARVLGKKLKIDKPVDATGKPISSTP